MNYTISCPEWSNYISNVTSRQSIRLKIFTVSDTEKYVDKCAYGPSSQRTWSLIAFMSRTVTTHHCTEHNISASDFHSPFFPLAPESFPPSLFHSLLWMFILKIYFSLGLKPGLHFKFPFTKQKNILLEGNGIKEKWFSVCPEAWHRQDLICYVQLESGLIPRDERGCLIKFTFHFLTWHRSPVTHRADGNAANNFCQNLVEETDWKMRIVGGGFGGTKESERGKKRGRKQRRNKKHM